MSYPFCDDGGRNLRDNRLGGAEGPGGFEKTRYEHNKKKSDVGAYFGITGFLFERDGSPRFSEGLPTLGAST